MLEILDQLITWHEERIPYAIGTVVHTIGSSPRGPGAAIGVSSTGVVVGSISGGCIEAAVVEAAHEALVSGNASYHRFGVSDDDAFAVGLTCGGIIEVHISPQSQELSQALECVHAAVSSRKAVALTTTLSGPKPQYFVYDGELRGTSGTSSSDCALEAEIAQMLASGTSAVFDVSTSQTDSLSTPVFINSFAPPPRMIIFGAIDFARALSQVGKLLGYFVTVCDAREVFATRARFPEADEVIVDWPHRYIDTQDVDTRTAICVLTHDPKFDLPLLERVLRLDVGYVGAMGSRSTSVERDRSLRLQGLSDRDLDKLHAPIGLDIGGRTPAETAIAIGAEIISARECRPGGPLKNGSAAIHEHNSHRESSGTPEVQQLDRDRSLQCAIGM